MIPAELFELRPGICAVVLPDAPAFTLSFASNDFASVLDKEKSALRGKGFLEFFDDKAVGAELIYSFEQLIENKYPQQLLVPGYLKQEDNANFWKVTNTPVLNKQGEVEYIIHCADNTGYNVRAEGIEKAYNLFMNAPVIIGVLRGENYVIDLANEGLLDVWGRKADVIGKPLLEALPELKEQGFIELLDKVRETGEPFFAYEFPITLHRNGNPEVFYFDFVYKAIYDEGDTEKASGIISVGHDVTPQVIAKKRTEESELKYRHLFESLDQGFCLLEMIFGENNEPLDYRFLETNAVFEKQTGLVNAKGKSVLELVPNLEKHWLQLYGNVALTGESTRFIEGSEAMGRWFEVYAFKMGGKSSNTVALLFTNITERKHNEEALQQSERNLRNTILQAPVAMSILRGPEFIVEIANQRMYELWGRGEAELSGRSIFEGLPESSDQGYEEILNKVYKSGEPFSANAIPVNVPRREGIETIYTNLLYTPFREGDGSISGIIVVASDVTDQVMARMKIEDLVKERTVELARANESLVHANEELKRSNENLEEFAYAASHDLKEPMRKIQLFSERLKDRLIDELKPEERHYFDRILHATNRMSILIDDLLMYSHVSKGISHEEMIDLNQKIKLIMEDLELEIEEKNVTIKVDELPVVKGQRRQIQQLFQNLIGNAIKYGRKDIPPVIKISSRKISGSDEPLHVKTENRLKDYYLIEVKDNGIGFEKEDAERIFNVFTRLHGNAEYKGTGVGLSIARKVVENHGGAIWAESNPGEGSSFKILFPANGEK